MTLQETVTFILVGVFKNINIYKKFYSHLENIFFL